MKKNHVLTHLMIWNIQKTIKGRGFLSKLLGQWLFDGASFALLYLIVTRYRWLAGWDRDQVLFLYSFHLLSFSVSAVFCQGLSTTISTKIRTGEMDQAFLKPVHPLLYALFQEIRISFLGRAPVALAAMCFSYGRMNVILSPVSILLCLIMLISALFAQSALWIAASSFGFLFTKKNPLAAVIGELGKFTRFPLQIYSVPMQVVLTFIIPLGFASFYPASVMANAISNSTLPRLLPFYSPLAGLFMLFCSIRLWHLMSAKYQSA